MREREKGSKLERCWFISCMCSKLIVLCLLKSSDVA